MIALVEVNARRLSRSGSVRRVIGCHGLPNAASSITDGSIWHVRFIKAVTADVTDIISQIIFVRGIRAEYIEYSAIVNGARYFVIMNY